MVRPTPPFIHLDGGRRNTEFVESMKDFVIVVIVIFLHLINFKNILDEFAKNDFMIHKILNFDFIII